MATPRCCHDRCRNLPATYIRRRWHLGCRGTPDCHVSRCGPPVSWKAPALLALDRLAYASDTRVLPETASDCDVAAGANSRRRAIVQSRFAAPRKQRRRVHQWIGRVVIQDRHPRLYPDGPLHGRHHPCQSSGQIERTLDPASTHAEGMPMSTNPINATGSASSSTPQPDADSNTLLPRDQPQRQPAIHNTSSSSTNAGQPPVRGGEQRRTSPSRPGTSRADRYPG